MLFGGNTTGQVRLADTWMWKDGCWARLGPIQSPSARFESAAAYDPNGHDVVLYGGSGCGGSCFDTWTWNGRAWTEVAATGPQLIGKPVAGYDPVGRRLLLFGWGPDGGQTWSWGGTTWARLHPLVSPQARVGSNLALDPVNGQLMLFGGRAGDSVGLLNDTWTWNGSSWTRLSPSTSPPPRYNAAMASWVAGKAVILAGGMVGPDVGDAWKWDGRTWSQIAPIGERIDAGAVDVGTRVLVVGGSDGNALLGDSQSWDGAIWSKA